MCPSSDALLSAAKLDCGYPNRVVLRNVDFELRPGSLTALLGPNGSGKSTLLKTFCKTLPPLDGDLCAAGKPLSKMSFQEMGKIAAYVPQEEVPPFRFTVRQVVLMGRLPHSEGLFDSPEDLRHANEAMEAADCLHLQDRAVNEISGGERQRALIARALAQEAPALLLDEPTAHLDVGHQVAVVKLLKDLAARGRAVLAAAHDLNWASAFATEAILLANGAIGLRGPMEEVLQSPVLDQTYGVRFERIRAENRTLVFPNLVG